MSDQSFPLLVFTQLQFYSDFSPSHVKPAVQILTVNNKHVSGDQTQNYGQRLSPEANYLDH